MSSVSGVIIGKMDLGDAYSYLVLTVAHGVGDPDAVAHAITQDNKIPSNFVCYDKTVDLALYTFTSPVIYPVITIAPDHIPSTGTRVHVVGYPGIPYLQRQDGYIFPKETRIPGFPHPLWPASLPSTNGASGSPVLSIDDELLGIVSLVSVVRDQTGHLRWNRVTLCVPLYSIHQFLGKAKENLEGKVDFDAYGI